MNVVRLFVTPELITEMLTTGYVFHGEIAVTKGIPVGAVLTAIGWDAPSRCWVLDFSHGSFDYVIPGSVPPRLEVWLERRSSLIANSLTNCDFPAKGDGDGIEQGA